MEYLKFVMGDESMRTATAKPAAKKAAPTPPAEFSEGQMLIEVRTVDPAVTKAAIDRTLASMKADKRKGDIVKYLREFRDNPRGE